MSDQLKELNAAQQRLEIAAGKVADKLAKFGLTLNPVAEKMAVVFGPAAGIVRAAQRAEAEQHERDRRKEMAEALSKSAEIFAGIPSRPDPGLPDGWVRNYLNCPEKGS